MPPLPAGLAASLLPQRPLRRRLGQPSLEGGLEEFRGDCASRASSSAIRSRARPSSARGSASSARSDTTSATTTSSGGEPRSAGTPGRYNPAGPPRRQKRSRTGSGIIAALSQPSQMADLTSYQNSTSPAGYISAAV